MREDLVSSIERLRTCRELMPAALELKHVGEIIGVPRISAVHDYSASTLILGDEGVALAEVFGWSADYVETWLDKKLSLASPIGHACRLTTKPFVWYTDAIWARGEALEKPQRKVLDIMAAQGAHGGITVPVHRPFGRVGSVGWTSEDADTDLEGILAGVANELILIAHYFLDVVYATREEDPPATDLTSLTEREIECLTWVALGKTDADIAVLIGRSPTTARFHIEKAMKKLNATTRTQAAAMASQLGVIGPVV